MSPPSGYERVATFKTDTPGNSVGCNWMNSTTLAGALLMIGAGWYGSYWTLLRSLLIWRTLSPVNDASAPLIVGCSVASARESLISTVVTFATSGCP
jgi:hypothetical protein